MAWVYLLIAGLAEIGFTTSMKMSNGFKRLLPSVLFGVCCVVSFMALSNALETIPLGTAYAVWTGIGAFGTALIGILVFKDSAHPARLALLGLLVASIVGLKLVSG